jgi:hypothetical protein
VGAGGGGGDQHLLLKTKKGLENTEMPPKLNKNSCRRCGSNKHKTGLCPNTATARAEDEKVRAAAAKADATAKRVAARAARQHQQVAARTARQQQEAINLAVYAALVAVVPVVVTPGIDRNSRWANVADLCASCGLPPGGCMCL